MNDRATVSLALVHPMKMWVNALQAVIAPLDDVEVVAAHTDPGWVSNVVAQRLVDVVLIAVDPEDGVALVHNMKELCPGVGILVISDSEDARFIADVVRAGARGYLTQSCSVRELVAAIHGVQRGETWMRPQLVSRLVEGLLSSESSQREEEDLLAALSAREREILHCLALGMPRKEIAERLFLSPNTVRTHIHHILRKLGVHSTLAAVSIVQHVPSQAPPPYFDDTGSGT